MSVFALVHVDVGAEPPPSYNRPPDDKSMNPTTLRILDANANRAREALRVLEDYARFSLNDPQLSGELKSLRHDFTAATKSFVADAISFRDTPNDVGTTIKTAAELSRESTNDVIIAAGKRLGEALRSLEEFFKTIDVSAAQKIESLRYKFYAIEQSITQTLRPPACGFANVRLYVLITESQCKLPWMQVAEQAIAGGAECLQLREKNLESGEFLSRARQFVTLCKSHGVISIINDRPDIALLTDADGVHVGQTDLPATEVRKLIGRDKILGVSTHEISQAQQAVRDGADYIGIGPIFRSPTKPRDFLPGLEYAREIANANLPIPAIAIAGITPGNVDDVLATGIRSIAVTSCISQANDVQHAARELKNRLEKKMVGQAFLPVSPSAADIQISRRNLPHWTMNDAIYFVTFRTRDGELAESERLAVFNLIKNGDEEFYDLLACVVMPDHAHILFRPKPEFSLSRIMHGTKGASARQINAMRKSSGALWQDESFDRIMRDQHEVREKAQYIFDNPVKRGLVEEAEQYHTLYVNDKAVG